MKLFVLIFTYSFIYLVDCMQEKRKMVDGLDTISAMSKHEKEHYADYQSKITVYAAWPEVDPNNKLNICRQYLSKMCPKTDLSLKFATTEEVELMYTTEVNRMNIYKVSGLQCVTYSPIFNRKIFYFIRAPDTQCVYLLQNNHTYSRIMKITLKVCEFHTHLELRKELRRIYFSYYWSRKNDTTVNIGKYEEDLSRSFSSNQTLYETWPELKNNVIMKQYCGIFLKKLYPNSQFDFHPKLSQSLIEYTIYAPGSSINVASLFCNATKSVYRNTQQFIRAPTNGSYACVFLISFMYRGRPMKRKMPHYKICRKLCADEQDDINLRGIEIPENVDLSAGGTQKKSRS